MINVYYSWPRPLAYLNMSATYAYIASEQLKYEYMSVHVAAFIIGGLS